MGNDNTKTVWDSNVTKRVEYVSRSKDKGEDGTYRKKKGEERLTCTVEEYPETLKKKITLITYFKSYFNKYKNKKVSYPIVTVNVNTNEGVSMDGPMVYIKQWMKTTHAMVFRLSNKCFQVAFFG